MLHKTPGSGMRKYGLPLMVGLMLLGQVLRIPTELVSFKKVAIVPNDVALVAFNIIMLIRNLRSRKLLIRNVLLWKPVLLFVFVCVVGLLVNANYYNLHGNELLVSGLYLGRWFFYTTAYLFTVDLIRSRRDVKHLVAALAVGLLAFAAFGIFQTLELPNFALIVHPEDTGAVDWDYQYDRLVSTFLDPNLAGCLIAVGLAFSVAFLMAGYRKVKFAIVIFGAALILTYSRGALLSFFVGLTYLVISGKHRHRVLVAAGLVGLIVLAAAPYLVSHVQEYNKFTFSDVSAQQRVANWLLCWDLIRDNFFLGVGFNTLPYVVPHYGLVSGGGSAFGLDGGLLLIFALSGFVGFTTYCYLLGKSLWMCHKVANLSKDPLYRVLARGSFAAVLIIVTSAFFTSSLLYSFIMEFFWMMLALLTFAYVLTKAEQPVPSEAARVRQRVAPRARFEPAVSLTVRGRG